MESALKNKRTVSSPLTNGHRPPTARLYVSVFAVGLLLLSCFSRPAAESAGAGGGLIADVGAIRSIGGMVEARSVHTATLLKNGKVLLAGGMQREGRYLDTAELYNPQTESFTPTGKMNAKRVGPVAILMNDGKVLVTGGIDESGSVASAETYDPETGRFSPAGDMIKAREAHALVQLSDGQILVAGGLANRRGIAEAELYSPSGRTFKLTGSMKTARGSVIAAPLPNGRVIVCGGTTDLRNVLASAEIYDPRSGTFTPTGDMNQPRFKFAANSLRDGRVLLTGGAVNYEWSGRRPTAEIFDPETERFTPAPNMNVAHFKHTTATATLPDGRVVIAGGHNRVEIFDPKTGTFSLVKGDLGDEVFFNTATALPNGKTLVTGGYVASSQGPPVAIAKAWLIDP
jgi:hypothetical protein